VSVGGRGGESGRGMGREGGWNGKGTGGRMHPFISGDQRRCLYRRCQPEIV
jgi:hypothetical protein